jgi:putative flippase GtrA
VAPSTRVREVAAFLVVGGLSALVDGGVFLILSALGVPPVLASAIGFMSAFAVNYGGNRRVVFRATGSGHLWRYIVLVLVNLGLSAAVVAAGIAIGLEPAVAKGVSIVLIAAINYVAMRQWVFRGATRSQLGSAKPEPGVDSAGD